MLGGVTMDDARPSPLSAVDLAQSSLTFGDLVLDGDDVYFVESRASEGGRRVIVRTRGNGLEDVTPAPWSARTRAHDYGGGAFTAAKGVVYFSEASDQRVYRIVPGLAPEPLTPAGNWRYADFVIDKARNRLLCVLETVDAGVEPRAALAEISLDAAGAVDTTSSPRTLVAGHDFYSAPRLSPDGQRLAFTAWNHPHMPWDEAELWMADVGDDGQLENARCIAGGSAEAVQQPVWSPDGVLHFVSDCSGWWNLYRVQPDGSVLAVLPMAAEFGAPQWVFGVSLYGFDRRGALWCAFWRDGVCRVALLDGMDLERVSEFSPFTDVDNLKAGGGEQAVVAALVAGPEEGRLLTVVRDGKAAVLRRSSDARLDSRFMSHPEAVRFPVKDGEGHAFFYRPVHAHCGQAPNEAPPLLVFCHSGPTGQASPALNWHIQFWTTRGFAVLDVNYGGSTGYGRAYRERLRHGWGEVDVEDCVSAAQWVAARGDVDPRRVAIRGKSAGGYTVLRALACSDVFCAGVAHYAVADLEGMMKEGPKFESHYAEWLIGPYPQEMARFRERSPLHHADKIRRPVLLLHGADDPVVPAEHSVTMARALREQGVPVAQVVFPGEGHGFRGADSIRRALEAELSFYAQVLGIELTEQIAPVKIANWPAR